MQNENLTRDLARDRPDGLRSRPFFERQIDYGVPGVCSSNSGQQTGYVCLAPRMFSYSPPDGCSKLIRGVCKFSRFEAGIEKYYVSEDKAKHLEDQIRSKSASIVLSITRDGQAQVKDLLVNGQSWKNQ